MEIWWTYEDDFIQINILDQAFLYYIYGWGLGQSKIEKGPGRLWHSIVPQNL